MPTVMFARPGAGTGAYQAALCTTVLVSVVMSNQIHPPSSKGASSTSNSHVPGAVAALMISVPPTLIRAPVALER